LRGAAVAIKDHVRAIEFSAERASDGLSLVSKLEHANIVKLLGYAHATGAPAGGVVDQPERKFRLLVVQEYMPNGSLESNTYCMFPQKHLLQFTYCPKVFETVVFFNISYEILLMFLISDDFRFAVSRHINWSSRFRIIKEIASGLCYLHNQRVIHSNLKSSNILLDSGMKPKICDFGVGRVLDHDDNLTNQDPGTL
jgi:serine/threonine protein kinase